MHKPSQHEDQPGAVCTRSLLLPERESGGDLDALMPHIAGRVGRRAYKTGDAELGVLSVGQSVAFADRSEPLAAIVRRPANEAQQASARLWRMSGSQSE
jgi:nitronate monooxygenase